MSAETKKIETAEELLFELDQLRIKYKGQKFDIEKGSPRIDESIELINQFKFDVIPSEKEVDRARKQKWEEYKHPSGTWVAYSNGFMDAINWLRNLTHTNQINHKR